VNIQNMINEAKGYEPLRAPQWWSYVVVVLLLVSSGLLAGSTDAGEQPIRIGTLNQSWGPVLPEVGLRDGLQELGFH